MNGSTFATVLSTTLVLFAGSLSGCGGNSSVVASTQDGSASKSAEVSIPTLVTPEAWKKPKAAVWAEVEKLENEQKFQAALDLVISAEKAAAESRNAPELARSLIKRVSIEGSLNQWEGAVNHLLTSEPTWPDDLVTQTVLGLYLAKALTNYKSFYSWEISSRDLRTDADPLDVRTWSSQQISERAIAKLFSIRAWREALKNLPVNTLEEFVETNNYPRNIRGTLADTVSYMVADVLADSSNWSVDESADVWRLDCRELLKPAERDELVKYPEKKHPLTVLSAVLRDLESIKASIGSREGALEARLTLLRLLDSHSGSNQTCKQTIIDSLTERLEQEKSVEWWTEGMFLLANIQRSQDFPDSLIKARATANLCRKKWPNSEGNNRCQNLIADIEARNISALNAPAIDGQGKRSLAIDCTNLNHLWFRAWNVNYADAVENTRVHSPDDEIIQKFTRSIEKTVPDIKWDTEIKNPGDFRQHRQWNVPPINKNGAWVIQVSAKQDFAESDNIRDTIMMFVGGPVVTSEQDPKSDAIIFRALSGENGDPLNKAVIRLYQINWERNKAPRTLIGKAETDSNGEARIKYDDESSGRLAAYVDWRGLTSPVPVQYYGYGRYDRTGEDFDEGGFVFTDRSIYRPGQKVKFKILAYTQSKSDRPFTADANSGIQIQLLDTNGEEVASTDVKTNAWGTASGEFEIPSAGKLLGAWTIRASFNAEARIRVEEYRIPSFTVEVAEAEGLRLNKPAELSGTASYYFGLPLSGAKAVWKIERQELWSWWWFRSRGQAPQIISSGRTETDQAGKFKINFVAEAGENQDSTDEFRPEYVFKVSVDITDDAGETHSASKSFHMGFSAVKASASADLGFIDAGNPAQIKLSRNDLNGNPSAGEISWKLNKIVEPSQPQLPADLEAPGTFGRGARESIFEGDRKTDRMNVNYDAGAMIRSWPDGRNLSSGKVVADKAGKALLTTDPLEPGFWRIRFETTDQYGGVFKDSFDFMVVSADSKTALPVLMTTQKQSYEVGEKLRLVAGSTFDGQYGLLQVYDRSGLRETRHMRLGKGTDIIEYQVDKSMRGGLMFRLTSYRDYQKLTTTARASVPWSDRKIDVSVEHLRDKITPGGRETVSLKVSKPAGKTGIPSAEILAWMYDKSLDDLALLTPPDVFSIWPGTGGAPAMYDNLGAARRIYSRGEGFNREFNLTVNYEEDSLRYLKNRWFRSWGGGGIRMARGAGAGAKSKSLDGYAESEESRNMDEVAAPSSMVMEKVAAAAPTDAEAAPAPAAPKEEVRSAFAETAFFMPHLITGNDGSVSLEYVVPDSITTWKLLAYATTKDLRSGHTEGLSISAKDLMLKPFLPRFLREGDQSTISAVVANTTDKEMSGAVTVQITDPATGEDLAARFALSTSKIPFVCRASGETTVSFNVSAPSRIGPVAFKIVASAGQVSDGELRSIPVLPGRYHLIQSRFATLHNRQNSKKTVRTLKFEEMQKPDPTRINDQMVITVDGQLFMSVLSALPYLTDYPYECAEQTMNKFLSAGIMTSLFDKFPGIAAMAKEASKRDTRLTAWNKQDPNRKMSLEETPWVEEASGGPTEKLLKVLDPAIARTVRETALSRLKQMQHADGAFPWFPGGPPSQWITLYVVSGMSRALEFKVDVPTDMLERAMSWTHNWYLTEKARKDSYLKDDWATATYLSWVLSNLPADLQGGFTAAEKKELLDLAFDNWKKMSPGMKSQITLALHRAGRADDATLVWASVMDSAKREQDRGMFWAPEERSWLWYNDSIEGHAQAIRTLSEVDPNNAGLDDLVLWLFINKKLNHWKSTRATAEVIYSLAHYLSANNEIGGTEVIDVQAAGEETKFVFDPLKPGSTTMQKVIEGSRLDDGKASEITISKETPGWAMASATWHFSTEKLPPKSEGDLLSIDRAYFLKRKTPAGPVLEPLTDQIAVVPGDEIEVQVQIKSKAALEYVHLRDPRPAGFEPMASVSRYHWEFGIIWYQEVRDSGENFFFEKLPNGEYTFRYSIRAAFAGTFKAAPATIQPMYAPEFAAYSSGRLVTIKEHQ